MEIQLADDVRAELMRLLHEERDKDRALLERLVGHLTVPPRSTWRVVELAGDGTPHDVPLEFPAQVVYIDNGSTKSVQVRAPGDIAQSPPIAASGQGRWLIPGATQVTVTGTGTGQVRLRFLNDAAARLLADNPPGGSTTSPVYASLTGSLAELTAASPTLVGTFSYTEFTASATLTKSLSGILHRNARARTVQVTNGLNVALTSLYYEPYDSAVVSAPTASDLSNYITASFNPGAGVTEVDTSEGMGYSSLQGQGLLAAHVDSLQVNMAIGATAPTSGSVTVHVTELF